MSAHSPTNPSRRDFLKTALVTAGAITIGNLSGCAPRQAAKNGARVTLSQWYHQYGEEGTKDAVLRYAAEYTKAHPDIAVEVIWVPGDYGTKLNTALLTQGGPDVFERAGITIPMVSAAQLAPLDDLFSPEVRRDFNADDLAANSVDGKIYAVKMVTDTGLIYYRKSLLEKAGIAPPRTLDDLIAVSKALTTKRRKGFFAGNDGGVGAAMTLALWSAGQDLMSGDKIAFDTPRTALAFEKLRELTESGFVLIGAPTDWWDPTAFVQEQCAMQWGGLWAYPAIKKALGEDVGALPWPALDAQGSPATFNGGWSQMVNSRSKHLDEAKNYVRYLWIENQKIQRDWNLSYGFHVPPRQSVTNEARALDSTVPALAVKYLREYGHITPPAWSGGMNTALSDAAINIVKLGRPAVPQIALAARKCERELERVFRFRE